MNTNLKNFRQFVTKGVVEILNSRYEASNVGSLVHTWSKNLKIFSRHSFDRYLNESRMNRGLITDKYSYWTSGEFITNVWIKSFIYNRYPYVSSVDWFKIPVRSNFSI